jgi:hypothetical protein
MLPLMAMGLFLAQGSPCMPLISIPGPSSLGINSSQRFISVGQQRLEREICEYQNPTPLLEIQLDPAQGTPQPD